MARPPKYKNKEDFQEVVDEFFEDCLDRERMPTKNGLAIYLDITRETLNQYERKEMFSDTIKKCYMKIEEAWNQALNKNGTVAGIIFYLKNAFAWRDERKIEHSGKVGVTREYVKNLTDEELDAIAKISTTGDSKKGEGSSEI